jgi:MFS family permease
VRALTGYIRSLNPDLPRSVQTLQLGGLFNAFGNGLILPFAFIYLHNVRGIGLGTAGLILATNAGVSMVLGPVFGSLVDRFGGRRMLTVALCFLAVGFGLYPFVHDPWLGFVAAALTGVGNGGFWAAQSTLIAGLTTPEQRPAAYAMQRVVMNLGIGLGGVAGGFIASTDDPVTFQLLFFGNAATFLVYMVILRAFVEDPPAAEPHGRESRPGRYGDVLRHRAFLGVLALNTLFIFAGMSGFELLPVYGKNEAGVSEKAIGLVYLANTLLIVATQLPIARLVQGRRRMHVLALMGVIWAAGWAVVPAAGLWLNGASAALLLGVAVSVFAIGECLHGAVQGPLVADLAEPRLMGRYMALSALSWQIGFTLGPAIGGFALAFSPSGMWLGAAVLLLLGSVAALALESTLPAAARISPTRTSGLQDVESGAMTPLAEDPLSHAEPATHPQDEAAVGGRGRPRTA